MLPQETFAGLPRALRRMGRKDSCQARLFPRRFIPASFGETNTPPDYTEPDLNKSKFQRQATLGDVITSERPPYLRVNLPQDITEQLQQLQRLQGVKRDQIVVLPEGFLIELLNNELDLVTHNCVPGELLQRRPSRCREGGTVTGSGRPSTPGLGAGPGPGRGCGIGAGPGPGGAAGSGPGRDRGGLGQSLARAVTAGTVARTRAWRHFRRYRRAARTGPGAGGEGAWSGSEEAWPKVAGVV